MRGVVPDTGLTRGGGSNGENYYKDHKVNLSLDSQPADCYLYNSPRTSYRTVRRGKKDELVSESAEHKDVGAVGSERAAGVT